MSDGTTQGHAASGHRTLRRLQRRDCKLGPNKWVEGGNESQPPLPLNNFQAPSHTRMRHR